MVEVVVQVQALARGPFERDLLLLAVAADRKTDARLGGGEHADQPVSNPVPPGDLPRGLLLVLGTAGQVAHLAPLIACDLQRRLLDEAAALLGLRFEVGHLDPGPLQMPRHPARVDHAPQNAANQQPIKPRQNTHDTTTQLLYKALPDDAAPRTGRNVTTPPTPSGPRHLFAIHLGCGR